MMRRFELGASRGGISFEVVNFDMKSTREQMTSEQRRVVAQYLVTGDTDATDAYFWPGHSFVEMEVNVHAALRRALIDEVVHRAKGAALPETPPQDELVRMTHCRVEPMVRGLFPVLEQDVILRLLERSVLFLTPGNIAQTLQNEGFHHCAWMLANAYLTSTGAEPLGGSEQGLLGLSQETTCYVTAKYLEGRGKFDDFLVHEAAHVFHNYKREFVGLPQTRSKEWLLMIDFGKRELFAYCCETYSRIVEQGISSKDRIALFEEYARDPYKIEGLDVEEHVDILREAVAAKNGWKRILARCAPARSGRGIPVARSD